MRRNAAAFDSTSTSPLAPLQNPSRTVFPRARIFSLFKRYWGRNDVIRGEKEREREKKKNATSTPHLNGANGKAFDTDAFAVLTDFVKVGRAVATAAEDAWMANIVDFACAVSGGVMTRHHHMHSSSTKIQNQLFRVSKTSFTTQKKRSFVWRKSVIILL